MSEVRRPPSPAARRKLLGDWAHDLKSLLLGQALTARQLQEGRLPPRQPTFDQMSASMEQLAFETEMFVEAAHACVGAPKEPSETSIDDLLRRATVSLGDRVTIEPSQIIVELDAYAVARTTREMVLLLSRSKVANDVYVSASAAGNRLTIKAVAGKGHVQPSAARLRQKLTATFGALRGLTEVVVTVNRDGRGLKAAFRVGAQHDSRPQVLVLTRDAAITREVARACRGAEVGVKICSTSMPILIALQEARSATQVAACVIDADLSDECTERLYQALGREPLPGRVLWVSDDGATPEFRAVHVLAPTVARGKVSACLRAIVEASAME